MACMIAINIDLNAGLLIRTTYIIMCFLSFGYICMIFCCCVTNKIVLSLISGHVEGGGYIILINTFVICCPVMDKNVESCA